MSAHSYRGDTMLVLRRTPEMVAQLEGMRDHHLDDGTASILLMSTLRHQSGFDYAGRVVHGPAPRDLPIPPHRYADGTRLIIGEPTQLT